MGIEVRRLREAQTMPTVKLDRRLWLTADGSRLVEDGDPEAAFLWAAAGDEVDAEELERLLGKKAKRKAEDKAVKGPAEDKTAAEGEVE